MKIGNFGIEILVHGRPIKEYFHKSEYYTEGRKGSEFTLRVSNLTSEQVEAVVTVDGLSVMNGKEGSFDVGGYLVPAFGHVNIPGWRLNLQQVAHFFFSEIGQSYAHQMGKPTNVGVIGCAIFCEKKIDPPIVFGDFKLYSMGPIRGGNEKGIGTGFGNRTEHHVKTVKFERASERPDEILTIRYAERDELISLGVYMGPATTVASANPFPAEVGCVPPQNWRG